MGPNCNRDLWTDCSGEDDAAGGSQVDAFRIPDLEYDLDYVRDVARPAAVDTFLSNSSGNPVHRNDAYLEWQTREVESLLLS